jgi:hypothetical protein
MDTCIYSVCVQRERERERKREREREGGREGEKRETCKIAYIVFVHASACGE